MSAKPAIPIEDPEPQPRTPRAERAPASDRRAAPSAAEPRDLSVEHVAVLGEN